MPHGTWPALWKGLELWTQRPHCVSFWCVCPLFLFLQVFHNMAEWGCPKDQVLHVGSKPVPRNCFSGPSPNYLEMESDPTWVKWLPHSNQPGTGEGRAEWCIGCCSNHLAILARASRVSSPSHAASSAWTAFTSPFTPVPWHRMHLSCNFFSCLSSFLSYELFVHRGHGLPPSWMYPQHVHRDINPLNNYFFSNRAQIPSLPRNP